MLKLNRTCKQCGTRFHEKPSRIARGVGLFCSRQCFASWRNRHGNQKTYAGCAVGGYRRLHVRIAENAIGKTLPKGWQVHHENGKKRDNRNENLIICKSARDHRLCENGGCGSFKWLGLRGGSVRLFILEGPSGTRICSMCLKWQSLDLFGVDRRSADGLRSRCKSCRGNERR